MPSEQGGGVNCFALLSRDNACQAHLTDGKITADWISERLDALSLSREKPDGGCAGQRAGSHQSGQRARDGVAGAGLVRLVPAHVFAAPEHCGGAVAQAQA